MKVLDTQLNELLKSTVSQHGYWLINHSDIIEADLKSGIVRYGLSKMIDMLDDHESPYINNLYEKIELSTK